MIEVNHGKSCTVVTIPQGVVRHVQPVDYTLMRKPPNYPVPAIDNCFIRTLSDIAAHPSDSAALDFIDNGLAGLHRPI